jgi:ABC-type glycerol-3-phosphate transport system substrate-binding protein
MWKQFSGTTLNFISENTPPSSAIAANTSPFTDLTGIKLNIAQMELGSVVQKVALDFGSGQSTYQVIYADPYQVLAPFYKGLVDLKSRPENVPYRRKPAEGSRRDRGLYSNSTRCGRKVRKPGHSVHASL